MMKYSRKALLVCSFILTSTFVSCFELFPDETVVYEGRIFEAFDKSSPIDSVLIQGCSNGPTLFPSVPNCEAETYTDFDGYFYISFKVDGLASRGISYGKEGYKSLDSCVQLNSGVLECFLEPLPTVFYVYSPTYSEPLTFDSLEVYIQTEDKDTTALYHTESFENTNGGTSYYWTNGIDTNNSRTSIVVPDDSEVILTARYFESNELVVSDSDTLFCPKGVGNRYKILN